MNRMREALLQAATGPALLAENSCRQEFCFAEKFIGFGGHFPGYPILPAMLQVLLGQLLAETLLGKPLQLVTLDRAKFTQQLRPGDAIMASLTLKEQNGQLRCTTELRSAETVAARFILILKDGE